MAVTIAYLVVDEEDDADEPWMAFVLFIGTIRVV
jgi:hypothetical protein